VLLDQKKIIEDDIAFTTNYGGKATKAQKESLDYINKELSGISKPTESVAPESEWEKTKRLVAEKQKQWEGEKAKTVEAVDPVADKGIRFFISGNTKQAELPDGQKVILDPASTKTNFMELNKNLN
jgi:hypothetical protein